MWWAYPSRADTLADRSLVQLIAPADRLGLVGISLNMLYQDISNALLVELVENGLHTYQRSPLIQTTTPHTSRMSKKA
ncbi:hypothetical protein PH30N_11589 [Cutibacterium modestum 30N]|nr:hypothetical protein [Cutibacterium modestum 30N]